MNRRLLYIFVLTLGLLTCDEEELKVPTEFFVKFGVNPVNLGFSNNNQSYQLKLKDVVMRIERVQFDGIRESGDNVHFDKTFSTPLTIEMLKDTLYEALHYEIPQGIYTHIGLKLSLKSTTSKPAFKMLSQLKGPGKFVYDVIFRFNYDEQIDLTVTSKSGNQRIVLDKRKKTYCQIDFLPLYILNLLKDHNISDAEVREEEDKYVIPLTSEVNHDLYVLVASRFTEGFGAYIKE